MHAVTRPTLREAVARLAPGTGLRDGLERILRGRTGALIVLGHDENVEAICDGGFSLDVRYAATRLRELCKMDGAVVLSTDGSRIVRANVQLVPDPSIPTDESGTRHRSAERQINATLDELDALSDGDLLDFTALAKVFGYPTTTEAQDSALSPRGYRAMAGIPRLQFAHADLLVRAFGTLQGLLAASAGDLQSVDGIGAMWARHVREGLSQLAESTISDQ